MRQQQAKTRILAEWRALPEAEQKSESRAVAFAMKIQGKYPFRCAGDPGQRIKTWLLFARPAGREAPPR
jgi:hypothetical protein